MLAASLSAHLGQQVTVVDEGAMDDGFSSLVRGPEPSGPPLLMAWEGILGMQCLNGEPASSTRTTIMATTPRSNSHSTEDSHVSSSRPSSASGALSSLGW